MGSNFLGDVGANTARPLIISYNEVIAREGQNLQKGMNYRRGDDGKLSVFIIFAGQDAPHKSEWNEDSEILSYQGHDATTAGKDMKNIDQPMMYGEKVSDNGKFYKEANAFKDGVRREPHQVQVYEKLDAAVFFDKGIFNLVDAKIVSEETRKVVQFYLAPADGLADESAQERMIPIETKVEVWNRDKGRCHECGQELGLHFQYDPSGSYTLVCAQHNKRKVSLL